MRVRRGSPPRACAAWVTLILEQAAHIGAAWHGHYEWLHLQTNKGLSALPFLPFSRQDLRYPSRLEVIRYLESYAQYFQLTPRLNQKVTVARRAGETWEVDTGEGRYRAAALVIASGYNREPRVPSWPEQSAYHGTVLHSSQYRSGAPFRRRDVHIARRVRNYNSDTSSACVSVVLKYFFQLCPLRATGLRSMRLRFA